MSDSKTEVLMPIEVRLVVRDSGLDTAELSKSLQDMVDDWYWKHIPTIPCGVITGEQK